jgi:DNA-binding response OmpR family regulator
VIEVEANAISVLSVSPFPDDHAALEQLLRPPRWRIYGVRTLKSAISAINRKRPSLVVCESHLGTQTWKDMLAEIALTAHPPFLIVTSRLADDYLWAEALNLGAYDVLAKPFDAREVARTLSSAWLHRRDRHDLVQQPQRMKAAAGY